MLLKVKDFVKVKGSKKYNYGVIESVLYKVTKENISSLKEQYLPGNLKIGETWYSVRLFHLNKDILNKLEKGKLLDKLDSQSTYLPSSQISEKVGKMPKGLDKFVSSFPYIPNKKEYKSLSSLFTAFVSGRSSKVFPKDSYDYFVRIGNFLYLPINDDFFNKGFKEDSLLTVTTKFASSMQVHSSELFIVKKDKNNIIPKELFYKKAMFKVKIGDHKGKYVFFESSVKKDNKEYYKFIVPEKNKKGELLIAKDSKSSSILEYVANQFTSDTDLDVVEKILAPLLEHYNIKNLNKQTMLKIISTYKERGGMLPALEVLDPDAIALLGEIVGYYAGKYYESSLTKVVRGEPRSYLKGFLSYVSQMLNLKGYKKLYDSFKSAGPYEAALRIGEVDYYQNLINKLGDKRINSYIPLWFERLESSREFKKSFPEVVKKYFPKFEIEKFNFDASVDSF